MTKSKPTMKKFTSLCILMLSVNLTFCQERYNVGGETLILKTEIDGDLDFLWNVFDNQFRYFVRTKDGKILELKNTKNKSNKFQEEYKTLLQDVTKGVDIPTKKLKFTRYSLQDYIDTYNAKTDSGYISAKTKSKIAFRLGFSAGITNNPFVTNPENIISPLIGAELELFEGNENGPHAGFLQLRHSFKNDNFEYSTSEISMGYRYRFIRSETFNIYGQIKLATVNFVNASVLDDNDMSITINETGFDAPLIFGIGSDIKISDNSYITIIYGELFALLLDEQDNFSTDISIGYKFDL